MLEKISSAQINEYLIKAASMLREKESEIASLKEKIASFERKEHAEKIASLAVKQGIVAEDEADEYAEQLAEGGQNLEMVEQLVGRSSRALALGRPLEKTASAEAEGSGGRDVLTDFLLSSELGQ